MTLTQAKDILKKFWFVILVGCIFIGFAVYFAWDTNKDKIPGKSVDGQELIFSTDNTNYTADEYYEKLFNATTEESKLGVQQLYNLLEKEVVSSVEATDEMEKYAEELAKQMETTLKQSYGDSYETQIGNQLIQLGYDDADDLEEFYLNMNKLNVLIADYVKANPKLFDSVYKNEAPREISHILVAVTDKSTEEQKAAAEKKKAEIMKQLDKGTDFAKVAKKYSDDEGSKKFGGSLGMQLKSASLVTEFKDAAWNLKEGEVSNWVKTEYGYHLIKVDTTNKKKLLKNKDNAVAIQAAVQKENSNLAKEVVWNKAKDLGLTIKDKKLKADLMKFIGVEK